MKYILTIPNSKSDKETIELFRTVDKATIVPLKVNTDRLSDYLWREFGINIDDKEYLARIAKNIIKEILE
jgi:hypothetical protein